MSYCPFILFPLKTKFLKTMLFPLTSISQILFSLKPTPLRFLSFTNVILNGFTNDLHIDKFIEQFLDLILFDHMVIFTMSFYLSYYFCFVFQGILNFQLRMFCQSPLIAPAYCQLLIWGAQWLQPWSSFSSLLYSLDDLVKSHGFKLLCQH